MDTLVQIIVIFIFPFAISMSVCGQSILSQFAIINNDPKLDTIFLKQITEGFGGGVMFIGLGIFQYIQGDTFFNMAPMGIMWLFSVAIPMMLQKKLMDQKNITVNNIGFLKKWGNALQTTAAIIVYIVIFVTIMLSIIK